MMREFVAEVSCHIPYDGCWNEWHYFRAVRNEGGEIVDVSPIFHPHQSSHDDYYDLTPERLTALLAGSRETMRCGAFDNASAFALGDEDSMRRLSETVPCLMVPAILKAFEGSEYDLFRKPWFRCDRCGGSIHESGDAYMSDWAGDGHGIMFLPTGILCEECYLTGLREDSDDDDEGEALDVDA